MSSASTGTARIAATTWSCVVRPRAASPRIHHLGSLLDHARHDAASVSAAAGATRLAFQIVADAAINIIFQQLRL